MPLPAAKQAASGSWLWTDKCYRVNFWAQCKRPAFFLQLDCSDFHKEVIRKPTSFLQRTLCQRWLRAALSLGRWFMAAWQPGWQTTGNQWKDVRRLVTIFTWVCLWMQKMIFAWGNCSSKDNLDFCVATLTGSLTKACRAGNQPELADAFESDLKRCEPQA